MNAASMVLVARTGWGAVLLAAPRQVLDRMGSDHTDDLRAHRVLRVLGARHLAQTAVELAGPRPAVLYLGAGIDGIHAVTSAVLAALDRRWRRSALVDTGIAAAFASTTALTIGSRST